MMPATFVLVHGGFHGGWSWRRVADLLSAAGHRVFTPTLTGAGERAHLLSPSLDFEVYVADVLGLIEAEELSEIVLVGHSFGGHVISVIADRRPELVQRLVYLDGVMPLPGLMNGKLPEQWQERSDTLISVNGVPCFPVPDPSYFGVTESPDADWLRRRLTPFPAHLIAARIELDNQICNGRPRTYVRSLAPLYHSAAVQAAQDYAATKFEHFIDLPTGHDSMVLMPNEVAAILVNSVFARRSHQTTRII